MAEYQVEVKRTPGRPRLEDGTPKQMAQRAKWRQQHRERRDRAGDSEDELRAEALFCVLLTAGWHKRIHTLVDEELAEIKKTTGLTNEAAFKDDLTSKITLREIRRSAAKNKLEDI